MFIRQLIYCSTATRPLADEEMQELIVQSSVRNAARAITSFLYCANPGYLHVLEGDHQAVAQLQARLSQDARHADMVTIMDETSTTRLFPGLNMGSAYLTSAALARLAGYLDPQYRSVLLPTSCNSQEVIMDLLHEFVAEQSLSIRPC
ncbi:BLUF domain-containing protein [Hymenobacter glacialis]|nr:BLUF domain-containing protein [Hymenobacter glacialis]